MNRASTALLCLAFGCSSPISKRPLLVFAASSFTDVFLDLEKDFEASHPTVDVQFSFAGTQALRLQIENGAPVDVAAFADPVHMQALHTAGIVKSPSRFTSNELVIGVRPGIGPLELHDLPSRVERIVLGDPKTPIGAYSTEFLQAARRSGALGEPWVERFESKVVSREANTRLTRTKVLLGEADVAVLYRSDLSSAQEIAAVAIPQDLQPEIYGMIASRTMSQDASDFIRFVQDDAVSDTFTRWGFRGQR